jgi:hypothetical protein
LIPSIHGNVPSPPAEAGFLLAGTEPQSDAAPKLVAAIFPNPRNMNPEIRSPQATDTEPARPRRTHPTN